METHSVQNLSAALVPADFRGKRKVIVQVWYIVRATLFRLSPHAFHGWRRGLIRLFGGKVGRSVQIRPSASIAYPWNISLGDYTYIGDEVILYSLDRIDIGAHVSISYRAFLCAGTHDPYDPQFPLVLKAIRIEDEAWLAADCFVAPGVHIGRGAVLGARSTALKDIPAFDIQVGNPAASKGSRKRVFVADTQRAQQPN